MDNIVPSVYLTRRNLMVLLSKLDRAQLGDSTAKAIVKNRNNDQKLYQQSMDCVRIVAVEDDDYYGAMQREPGIMHPKDEPK